MQSLHLESAGAGRRLRRILASLVCSVATAAEPPGDPLWQGSDLTVRLPFVRTVAHTSVHQARQGEYQFLHGPAVTWFQGALYASWAASPVDENSAAETLRYSSSEDGGRTWREAAFISPTGRRESFSHGTFQVVGSTLFAFAARFVGPASEARDGSPTFAGLAMELFLFDRAVGRWQSRGQVARNFWPMDEPKRMPDGSWIMGGLDAWERPVVAVSRGPGIEHPWRVIGIPVHPGAKLRFAETSVFITADGARAVVRGTGKPGALVSDSCDGKTWSALVPSQFPMGNAKPYAGTLSTGQPYLVCNLFGGRNVLGIAVGRPGGTVLQRAWRIRDGVSAQPLFPGRAKSPQWSYPYAHEHDGNLYIVYSVGKEDCEMSIIPVNALQVVD